MTNNKSVTLFEEKEIRRHWDGKKELWYFSVVDIIGALTNSRRPRQYWADLKKQLKKEGSELSDKIVQLRLLSRDGKKYLTDVADTETVLRLIQSIPSPKVEPLKLWLAQVGYQRIEEIEDPELAFDRAMETYLKKGYSKEWINQRLKSIEVRKELTDEWSERSVEKGKEFAILTNEITKTWAGKTVQEYKKHKSLKKENLRDNMTNLELVLNMLAEASTTEISKKKKPKGLEHNKKVARKGGKVAKKARDEIETQLGETIISKKNAKQLAKGKMKGLEDGKENGKD